LIAYRKHWLQKPSLPRSFDIRVTRRVCEKVAQTVAQPICITSTMEKSSPKFWATFVTFQKNALRDNSPNRRT
jgi:hypothetical protein